MKGSHKGCGKPILGGCCRCGIWSLKHDYTYLCDECEEKLKEDE